MAIITLSELISVLEQHPEYKKKWEKEVPASQSLCIRFGESKGISIVSDVLETINSNEIAVDKDINGVVYSLEIF